MPYFYNKEINILLIHIPKTGGTSLEVYFSRKYFIPLNENSLFMFSKHAISNDFNHKISLQHQTYNTLFKFRNELNINFSDENNKIKIISIVRNPYDRIISDLFYFRLINIDSNPDKVYNVIKFFINTNTHRFDNHNIPQYLFITDETEKLIDNIIILKNETLTNDMINIGFTDFKVNLNINEILHKSKYDVYLNTDSIKLINSFYKKDFELFNYEMKDPDK